MPELPEVENFSRALAKAIEGKTILRLQFHRPDIRAPLDVKSLRAVLCVNENIRAVDRVGKKIRLQTSKGFVLVGLGMSGSFHERSGDKEPLKHEHVTIQFKDGTAVGYVDPRRFGSWEAFSEKAKNSFETLSAADPLVPESLARLFLDASFRKSQRRIWDTLLDQKKIGGLGNIYALEALFLCGIHPATSCANVAKHKLLKLAVVIPPLLQTAIAKGGSTISSYRNFEGEQGTFQDSHKVYGRAGKTCHICNSLIVRMVFGARGVYLCPTCQPFEEMKQVSKLIPFRKKGRIQFGTPAFIWEPGQHVELVPLEIPKPWGKEIWYSGIEQRGVNQVRNLKGQLLDLPTFVESCLLPAGVKGKTAVPLLKILDPNPVAVLGDLYTEVHAVKNEVYICIEADPKLYPTGVGLLRYGVNTADQKKSEKEIDHWKADFLRSVKEYESCRQKIDQILVAKGLYSSGQPSTKTLENALKSLPASLVTQEAKLRQHMNQFTCLYDFPVGTFARVPIGVPHALQAGVKVVEFQTNSYERWIVSFAQKVATQNHWDAAQALQNLDTKASLRSPIGTLSDKTCLSLLALFPEYALFFAKPQILDLRDYADLGGYCVAFVMPGSVVTLDGKVVKSDGYLFVPKQHQKMQIVGAQGVLLAFTPIL